MAAKGFLGIFMATTLGVLLLLGGASEWLLRAKVMPEDHFWRHMALFEQDDRVDAAFGDSHVARGFLGDIAMVNLASPSENLDQIALKIEHFFEDRSPGRVVLQADPHLFSTYRMAADDRNYPDLLADGSLTSSGLALFDSYYRPRLLRYWMVALLGNDGFVSTVEFTANGAQLSDTMLGETLTAREQLALINRVALHHSVGEDTDAQRLRYAQIVEDLRNNGARVCLVGFPVSAPYRAVADQSESFLEARNWFRDLASTQQVAYHDYWEFPFENNEFQDWDHLNTAGSERFSADVLETCFAGNDTE